MDNDLVYRASTLIYKGLNPRSNPLRDKEYKELLVTAISSSEFMGILDSIAGGLSLTIVDLSEKGLILAPSGSDSSFSMGVVDYRKELKHEGAEVGIGLAAIIQIAVAFTIFPTDDDLEESDTLLNRSTTIKEIGDLLTRLCKNIVNDEDNEKIPSELRSTAEAILELPENIPTQNRPTFKSINGAVSIIVNHLESSGLLKFEESLSGGFYFPTYRYHMLLKRRSAGKLYEILKEKTNQEE